MWRFLTRALLTSLLVCVAIMWIVAMLSCSTHGRGENVAEHQSAFDGRIPLDAPDASIDALAFSGLPREVPVLLFHEICPTDTCVPSDTYGMSRVEFRRTLQMLKAAGYSFASTSDYVRYVRSDWAGLPDKMILLTFDDGRLDAYVGADDSLAAEGAQATMFVITDFVNNPSFLSWSELSTMQASGHWDLQLHANKTHVLVDGLKPLCNRLGTETYDEWKARAEGDIWSGLTLMHANVSGYNQKLFAVPYGDYGQISTNDPAIPVELHWFLSQRFAAWFVQPPVVDYSLTNSSSAWTVKPRHTVLYGTTAETIYAWLSTRALSRAKTPTL